MAVSAYHFRDFYKTLGGRIVRRLIREEIVRLWPDTHGLRILGGGYAVPYLKHFTENTERTVAVMFSGQGVHYWPDEGQNLAALAHETELPFETNSVDRILLIHSLEFTGFTKPALEEFWRVLKSNGRLLLVVPNRMGLWARAHWTPFGHGMPYSAGQVEEFLRENLFMIERTERALFIPPFKSQTLLRTAGFWEKVGKKICPAMGGVIFVEASKQIYASTGRGKAVRVTAMQPRPITEGAPEPT